MASSIQPDVVMSCDVCSHRQRTVSSYTRCRECNLGFCEDCTFTHSKLPVCTGHFVTRTLDGVLYEGTSVDDDSLLFTDGASDVEEEEDPKDGIHLEEMYRPQFNLYKEFNTYNEEKDDINPEIRDVVLLESDVVVVSDWANCTIKAFNTQGVFIGEYFFNKSGKDAGRIHGLTLKDPNTVCATLPSYKNIATITVKYTGDSVEFSPLLHLTKRRYFGIAHLARTKQLVAGTTDRVDILSYSCHLLVSLSTPGFANPYNMGIETPSTVLVSDTKANCLYRISADQEVSKIEVGDRQDYKQLRGVTADASGNIFFGGIKREGIGWINTTGDFMGYILSGNVDKPVGIHFQKTRTGRYVVVSQNDSTIKLLTPVE